MVLFPASFQLVKLKNAQIGSTKKKSNAIPKPKVRRKKIANPKNGTGIKKPGSHKLTRSGVINYKNQKPNISNENKSAGVL